MALRTGLKSWWVLDPPMTPVYRLRVPTIPYLNLCADPRVMWVQEVLRVTTAPLVKMVPMVPWAKWRRWRSVTGATVNDAGELIVDLSAGGPINAGVVVGANGQDGAAGLNGTNGDDDGASLNSGELVLNLSVGDPINVGDITGATVNDVQIDDQGVMQLFMSDGRLLTAAGNAKGLRVTKAIPVTKVLQVQTVARELMGNPAQTVNPVQTALAH